ncbi:MAG TPA: hypothetical protein VL088_06990 [Pedobacter sp.]|nr:hypothetical protein [Pedobacter sp.]
MKKYLVKSYLIVFLVITVACLASSCKKKSEAPDTPPVVIKPEVDPPVNPPSFVTNAKNLNIVMFVPNDNPALADYKTRLTTLMIHFQKWFHTEMLRYGYDKYMGLPIDGSTKLVKFIEIKGQQGQADYPYSSSVSAGKILAEIAAYKTTHPSEFSSANHTLILLPNRTDGGDQPFYGYGKNCFAVDNANMAVNKIPNTTSNLLGGMLHELGHGLNLPHDHAKYYTEEPTLGTSLMGSGNVTFSKGQKTFLTEVDAAILNNNEIFQNPVPAEAFYESATTSIDPKVNFNPITQAFDITGSFTSDKTVSDILIYLDPNVNDEGYSSGVGNVNYNAVAWRFNPGAGSTINASAPIKELNYKTDEPYELFVKLLLKNGSTISKSYQFNFKAGVPQIGVNGSAKFYQNASYAGYQVELPVGEYTTAAMVAKGIKDKDISSVVVGLGVKVILYSGDNFTGTSFELTSSSSYVSAFNDKTSSIKIMPLN